MSEYSEVQSGEISFGNFPRMAERSVEDELQEKLKPAAFGGYSKGSVNQYTRELKSSLEQMRANLEQQIKELAAEKGNLSQECSLLRSQLSEAEKRVVQLQKESQERERKVAQIMEEMNLKVRDTEHENETLRLENAKVKEARLELEHVRQQLQTKENEAGSLTVQLEKSQNLCEELKSRIQKLEKIQELPSADASELERLKEENESLTGRLQEAEQCGQTLREKCSRETEALSGKLQAAEQQNRQLQASLAELEDDRSEHRVQFEKEYLEKLNMAYRALQEAKEEKNGLMSRIAEQSKAGADLTAKFNLLRDRLVSLRSQGASLKDEKAALEEQVAQFRRKEQEQELLKRQNESLSREIAATKAGVKDILSQMELQKAMILDIISRSTESFAKTREKLQSLIQEKTGLKGRNENLMEEIGKLTADLSAAELEKTQLRKRLGLQEISGSAKQGALSDAAVSADGPAENQKMTADVFVFDQKEEDDAEETPGCPSIDAARNQALDITKWLARNSDEIRTRYAVAEGDSSRAQREEE